MNNYDMALKSTTTSLNSQGSAMHENQKYQQSLEAQIAKLQTAWKEFSLAFGDEVLTDAFTNAVAGLTELAKAGTALSSSGLGTLPILLGSIATAIVSLDKKSRRLSNSLFSSRSWSRGFTSGVERASSAFSSFAGTVQQSHRIAGRQARRVRGLGGAWKYVAFNARVAGKAMRGALVSTGVGAIVVGLTLAVEKIIEVNAEARKARQEVENIVDSYTNNEGDIGSKIEEFEKLYDKQQRGISLLKEEQEQYTILQNKLGDIIPSLVKDVDEKGNKHLKNVEAIKEEISYLEKLQNIRNKEKASEFDSNVDSAFDEIQRGQKKLKGINIREDSTKGWDKYLNPKQLLPSWQGHENERYEMQQRRLQTARDIEIAQKKLGKVVSDGVKNELALIGELTELTDSQLDLILKLSQNQEYGSEQEAKEYKDYLLDIVEALKKLPPAVTEAFTIDEIDKMEDKTIRAMSYVSESVKDGGENWDTYETMLGRAGMKSDEITEYFEALKNGTDDLADSTKNAQEEHEKLVEEFENSISAIESINGLLKDLDDGDGLSIDSIGNILKNHSELIGHLNDEKTLREELRKLKEKSSEKAQEQIEKELMNSKGHYETIKKENKKAIDSISEFYDEDIGRFKNISNAKEAVLTKTLEKLKEKWNGYYDFENNQVTRNGVFELQRNPDGEFAKLVEQMIKMDGLFKKLATNGIDLTDVFEKSGEEAEETAQYILRYRDTMDALTLAIEKQQSIKEKFAKGSKEYREALDEEIRLIKEQIEANESYKDSVRSNNGIADSAKNVYNSQDGYENQNTPISNSVKPLEKGFNNYSDLVNQVGSQYGVEPYVIASLIDQESGWNPSARPETSNATGLMQIIPKYHDTTRKEMLDPLKNITKGVQYLSNLINSAEKAGLGIESALQSYNYGGAFIDYAKDRGGYSLEVAQSYSDMMTKKYQEEHGYGKDFVYGDSQFVQKIKANFEKYQDALEKATESTEDVAEKTKELSNNTEEASNNTEELKKNTKKSSENANNVIENNEKPKVTPNDVAKYYMTEPFHKTSDFRSSKRPDHNGLDLGTWGKNPDIKALFDGFVTHIGYEEDGAGHYVVITHNDGTKTRYMHMVKRPDLKVDQKIKSGDKIGNVGDTGKSNGEHLHLEYIKNPKNNKGDTDPYPMIQKLAEGGDASKIVQEVSTANSELADSATNASKAQGRLTDKIVEQNKTMRDAQRETLQLNAQLAELIYQRDIELPRYEKFGQDKEKIDYLLESSKEIQDNYKEAHEQFSKQQREQVRLMKAKRSEILQEIVWLEERKIHYNESESIYVKLQEEINNLTIEQDDLNDSIIETARAMGEINAKNIFEDIDKEIESFNKKISLLGNIDNQYERQRVVNNNREIGKLLESQAKDISDRISSIDMELSNLDVGKSPERVAELKKELEILTEKQYDVRVNIVSNIEKTIEDTIQMGLDRLEQAEKDGTWQSITPMTLQEQEKYNELLKEEAKERYNARKEQEKYQEELDKAYEKLEKRKEKAKLDQILKNADKRLQQIMGTIDLVDHQIGLIEDGKSSNVSDINYHMPTGVTRTPEEAVREVEKEFEMPEPPKPDWEDTWEAPKTFINTVYNDFRAKRNHIVKELDGLYNDLENLGDVEADPTKHLEILNNAEKLANSFETYYQSYISEIRDPIKREQALNAYLSLIKLPQEQELNKIFYEKDDVIKKSTQNFVDKLNRELEKSISEIDVIDNVKTEDDKKKLQKQLQEIENIYDNFLSRLKKKSEDKSFSSEIISDAVKNIEEDKNEKISNIERENGDGNKTIKFNTSVDIEGAEKEAKEYADKFPKDEEKTLEFQTEADTKGSEKDIEQHKTTVENNPYYNILTKVDADTTEAKKKIRELNNIKITVDVDANGRFNSNVEATNDKSEEVTDQKKATGDKDFKGGTVVVGEKGKELIVEPDGTNYLSGETSEVRNLPKGTKIYSNEQTEKILREGNRIKNDVSKSLLPQYYNGSADIENERDFLTSQLKEARETGNEGLEAWVNKRANELSINVEYNDNTNTEEVKDAIQEGAKQGTEKGTKEGIDNSTSTSLNNDSGTGLNKEDQNKYGNGTYILLEDSNGNQKIYYASKDNFSEEELLSGTKEIGGTEYSIVDSNPQGKIENVKNHEEKVEGKYPTAHYEQESENTALYSEESKNNSIIKTIIEDSLAIKDELEKNGFSEEKLSSDMMNLIKSFVESAFKDGSISSKENAYKQISLNEELSNYIPEDMREQIEKLKNSLTGDLEIDKIFNNVGIETQNDFKEATHETLLRLKDGLMTLFISESGKTREDLLKDYKNYINTGQNELAEQTLGEIQNRGQSEMQMQESQKALSEQIYNIEWESFQKQKEFSNQEMNTLKSKLTYLESINASNDKILNTQEQIQNKIKENINTDGELFREQFFEIEDVIKNQNLEDFFDQNLDVSLDFENQTQEESLNNMVTIMNELSDSIELMNENGKSSYELVTVYKLLTKTFGDFSDSITSLEEQQRKLNESSKRIADEKLQKYKEVEDKIEEMIRKRVEKEKEALDESLSKYEEHAQKIIDLKREQEATDDFEKNLEKEQEKLLEIQKKYNKLLLDDSYEAESKRLELKEQMSDQEEKIMEMKSDRQMNLEIKNIEKLRDQKREQVEDEKKLLDEELNTENLAREVREVLETGKIEYFKEVGGEIQTPKIELHKAYKQFENDFGEGLSIIGSKFKYEFTQKMNELLADFESGFLFQYISDSIHGTSNEAEKGDSGSGLYGGKQVETFDGSKIDAKNKEWKVNFNEEIDKDSLGDVRVLDQNGQEVNITTKLSNDGKSVIIEAPDGGYNFDKIYSLFVEGVKDITGTSMEEIVNMKFDLLKQSEIQEDSLKLGDRIYLRDELKSMSSDELEELISKYPVSEVKKFTDGSWQQFNTGGYTGSSEGLAWLDRKEIVLDEQDTSNLFKTVSVVDKIIANMPRLDMANLSPKTVPQTPSSNEYIFDIKIDKVMGDKDGAKTLTKEFMRNIKSKRGGIF